MSTITKPNTFSNGAVIVASEHNANFDTIYNDYNGSITNANISASAAISATKLSLATIAQTIAMSSSALNFAKGSDIPSVAGTTDIGAMTGNYADVTGTNTITGLGTIQAGTIRWVRFTGALILTHSGTALMLPTAANITTVAGDVACFVSLGSGNWKCLFYQRYDGTALVAVTAANSLSGSVIQTQYSLYSTKGNVSTSIPDDDTIPTYAEGTALTSVSITPSNASNILRITAWARGSINGGGTAIGCVYITTGTGVTAGIAIGTSVSIGPSPHLEHEVVAGGTSAITFYLLAGTTSGTWGLGKDTSGADKFGALPVAGITVQEIKA